MVKAGIEGGRSAKSGLSIPEVRESELTPLERGLIGQVVRLMDSVEEYKESCEAGIAQLTKENRQLLSLLREQEQRISLLQKDIKSFAALLSR